MRERELSFHELTKLFRAHGCQVTFNSKTQYLTLSRGAGRSHVYWKVHCHAGRGDAFEPRVVRAARRRLGFADMSGEEFYKPLG